MRQTFSAASTFRLTAYDAAYLEIARREQLPLATLDRELIHAAKPSERDALLNAPLDAALIRTQLCTASVIISIQLQILFPQIVRHFRFRRKILRKSFEQAHVISSAPRSVMHAILCGLPFE